MDKKNGLTDTNDQESNGKLRFTPAQKSENRIPLAIRIKPDSYKTLQELSKIYGLRYAYEVMERALGDALAYHGHTKESDNGASYPLDVIEYFKTLPSDHQTFLFEHLAGNPAVEARINYQEDWQRDIKQKVNELIPYTTRKQLKKVRSERRRLLEYLKVHDIQPK